jgi:hypothetical protein
MVAEEDFGNCYKSKKLIFKVSYKIFWRRGWSRSWSWSLNSDLYVPSKKFPSRHTITLLLLLGDCL